MYFLEVNDDCSKCLDCVDLCIRDALSYNIFDEKLYLNGSECSFCEVCMDICPSNAILIYDD